MLAVYFSANQGYVNILRLVQTQKTIDYGQKMIIFRIGTAATNTAGNCLDLLLIKYQVCLITIKVLLRLSWLEKSTVLVLTKVQT